MKKALHSAERIGALWASLAEPCDAARLAKTRYARRCPAGRAILTPNRR
jgi:hypothetical protein